MEPAEDISARLLGALQQNRRSRGLEAALEIGGVVLDGWFGGDLERWRSGQGERTLRELARAGRSADGPDAISTSSLYRFVAITALCRRMERTQFAHLGTSHLRQVLPLPPEEQVEVVQEAEEGRWTVQQVIAEVRRRQRRRRQRGRPSGGCVGALPLLRRWAKHQGRVEHLDALDQMSADRLERLEQLVRSAADDLGTLAAAIERAKARRQR